MSTTLCLDFGNTRNKAAIFKNDKIISTVVLESLLDDLRAMLKHFNPDSAILSSVINHPDEVESLLAQKTKFHKLSHQSRLPFTTPIARPETIGADRLAALAGAVIFYPQQHNLIITLGSCITCNFITKGGEFLGGSISPGLNMRLKAMHEFTAKLPLIAPEADAPLIGYDTKTNILSGAILGMAYEIDGFITAFSDKFNNFNAILTGGDTIYLEPHIRNKIFADLDLTFKGLYAISQSND